MTLKLGVEGERMCAHAHVCCSGPWGVQRSEDNPGESSLLEKGVKLRSLSGLVVSTFCSLNYLPDSACFLRLRISGFVIFFWGGEHLLKSK